MGWFCMVPLLYLPPVRVFETLTGILFCGGNLPYTTIIPPFKWYVNSLKDFYMRYNSGVVAARRR